MTTMTPGRKSLLMGMVFTLWYLVLSYLYALPFGLDRRLEPVDYITFTIIFSLLFAAIHYWGVKKR